MTMDELLKLADELESCARLSLLSKIPIPCPGGYTYLQRDDLRRAATMLRARTSGDSHD